MATFTITTNAYVNQPPTQVGNGSASTDYGQTYTFSSADFTTNTTPVYLDPEGDPAYQLRVIGLTTIGTLRFNGINVTINQIIDMSDIDNDLFVFVPDNGTTTTYPDTFQYEVSDAGSQQFVG